MEDPPQILGCCPDGWQCLYRSPHNICTDSSGNLENIASGLCVILLCTVSVPSRVNSVFLQGKLKDPDSLSPSMSCLWFFIQSHVRSPGASSQLRDPFVVCVHLTIHTSIHTFSIMPLISAHAKSTLFFKPSIFSACAVQCMLSMFSDLLLISSEWEAIMSFEPTCLELLCVHHPLRSWGG